MKVSLDRSVQMLISIAREEAKRSHQQLLTAEHILSVGLMTKPIRSLLETINVNVTVLEAELYNYINLMTDGIRRKSRNGGAPIEDNTAGGKHVGFNPTPNPADSNSNISGNNFFGETGSSFFVNNSEYRQSMSFIRLMEAALQSPVKANGDVVGIRDMLFGFTELESQGISCFPFSKFIATGKLLRSLEHMKMENYNINITAKDFVSPSVLEGDDEDEEDEDEEGHHGLFLEDRELEDETNMIGSLLEDLCESVKTGDSEFFIGKEDVLHNIYEILLRKQKNNLIIVGEAGVGKTAIIRELARKLVSGNVPPKLKECSLYSLDMVSLVAGTRYRGDFEDRVKRLIDALADIDNCILFLDDIHNIINAGASAGNSNDFGDLMKSFLLDQNIRCIGATTYDEYKQLEKDMSLLRRFSVVDMPPASKKETLEVLGKVKKTYENFYDIVYSRDVLECIVNLSDKYILERAFPDKALDVVDALGAMLQVEEFRKNRKNVKISMSANVTKRSKFKPHLSNLSTGEVATDDRHKEKKTHVSENDISHSDHVEKLYKEEVQEPIRVTSHHVEQIVSRISKRPLATIRENEMLQLKSLSSRISTKIFGQAQAVSSLSKVIIRSRTGLRESTKPIASLLFVGPTGVGKTEISKQLAIELGLSFHRFDMSEYQERHSISKFIGSPPGYVGHEQGGILIDVIRKNPNSVLLLDEIEKAHNDIFNLLLQAMDYATITDSTGRQADFRNVIIIMTSNVGAQESIKNMLGFTENMTKGVQEIKDGVKDLFSPEFRNRLDEIIIFESLSENDMKSIVKKSLKDVANLLRAKNIVLKWHPNVVNYLVEKGFTKTYGARSILRVIESEIKDKVADFLIQHSIVDFVTPHRIMIEIKENDKLLDKHVNIVEVQDKEKVKKKTISIV